MVKKGGSKKTKVPEIGEKLLNLPVVSDLPHVSQDKHVASIDVGIRNLALCIFCVKDKDNFTSLSKPSKMCSIIHWDVINLCDEEKVRYCDHCKYQAVYEKIKSPSSHNLSGSNTSSAVSMSSNHDAQVAEELSICTLSISSSEDEEIEDEKEEYEYFCKRHSKIMGVAGKPPLPKSLEPNVIKKLKYNDLMSLCEEENINVDKVNNKKLSKSQILNKILTHCKFAYLNLVTKKKVNAKDISLVEIGSRLVLAFDKVKHMMNLRNTTVLIENQISPLANRMKTIQGMITQYFIMNLVHDVIFVSSINKLKDFVQDSGDYSSRKKKGVSICKDIVMTNDSFSNKADVLEISKKKDDMADSFLQGLWYLRKYGYFQMDSAIYSS